MTADHRRLPRKKRPISPRDQAIYIAYRSQGRTQAQLARQFRLGQRRISTIIQRVEQAQSSADAAAPISHVEIARACVQQLYTSALRSYDHAPAEITTTQSGHRGQSPFQITTCRQLPPNHHLLKAALTASRDLTRLALQPPPSAASHVSHPPSNYSNCSNSTSTELPEPSFPSTLPSEIQKQENFVSPSTPLAPLA